MQILPRIARIYTNSSRRDPCVFVRSVASLVSEKNVIKIATSKSGVELAFLQVSSLLAEISSAEPQGR